MSNPTSRAVAAVVIAVMAVTGVSLLWYSNQMVNSSSSSSGASSVSSSESSASTSSAETQTKFASTDIQSLQSQSVSIEAKSGETFIIHLAAQGSTGYDWHVSISGDSVEYLNYSTTGISTLVGGPVQRDYFFRAVKTGEAVITFSYERAPPGFVTLQIAKTLVLNVTVTDGASADQQPLMLSYNFQVNATGGYLFLVLKNYGSSNSSISSVYLDGVLYEAPYLQLDPICSNFIAGTQCAVTLLFGQPHPPPALNSVHSLSLVTYEGKRLSYSVTAGYLYHAGCTYTESC